jgi:hypothetical protein
MMQKFFTKFWLASQVALLFAVVGIGIFGTQTAEKNYLLWLSLVVIESLLLLPTVFKDEAITEARKRVLRSIEGDGFTYVGIVLVVVIGIQWVNSGCSLVYLPDADIWKFSLPPVEWLPYSVQPLPARALLYLVAAVVAGGLAIRNGLGKGGKRFLLEAATFISGLLAAYAVCQSLRGVAPYTTWTSHPGACNPGSFFAFWFFVALGQGISAVHSKWTPLTNVLWWGFSFIGNAAGFLQFSPALGVVVYTVLGVLLLTYRIIMFRFQRVQGSHRLRFVFGTMVSVGLLSFSILFLIPKSPIIPKVKGLSDMASFDQMVANRRFRMDAAFKIWQEAPWTGVGAKGFSQYVGTVIVDREWKQLKIDRQLVQNDGFQFLCEWGVIGAGLLVAMIITLLIPLFVRLRALVGGGNKHGSAWEAFLSADALFVPCVVAVILFLVEGWFSSPFQSPALMMSWFIVLAVLPGLLPARRIKNS